MSDVAPLLTATNQQAAGGRSSVLHVTVFGYRTASLQRTMRRDVID